MLTKTKVRKYKIVIY